VRSRSFKRQTNPREIVRSAVGRAKRFYPNIFAAIRSGSWMLQLLDRDEPRFAEASHEVTERGDYLFARFTRSTALPCGEILLECTLLNGRRSLLTSRVTIGWVSVAAAVVWISLCFRLGHLPLISPDEGRNAEVGREMQATGAWLVPTYNGVDYLDKPAFYFKVVAVSLAIFGDNQTAARLPSAGFGVALVALILAFCRKIHGTRCGLLAAIVVATTCRTRGQSSSTWRSPFSSAAQSSQATWRNKRRARSGETGIC
jgi:hypothetical protein